jgi:translation initiation factor IF-1
MGEIAEMMLNGEVCEGCGVFLENEDRGFPVYCSNRCAADAGIPKKKRKHLIREEIS